MSALKVKIASPKATQPSFLTLKVPMLNTLNAPQREAVKYLEGPLLVLAGAGSGKTRVITQKIAYLIQECGFAPKEIAAITFTNKAAREMQERVSQLLAGVNSKGLTIATFHSLGMQIAPAMVLALLLL